MDYLDKSKLDLFNQAQQNPEAAREKARTKEYLSPAEIRENARKEREKREAQNSPWNEMK